jgi:hypothetical protein
MRTTRSATVDTQLSQFPDDPLGDHHLPPSTGRKSPDFNTPGYPPERHHPTWASIQATVAGRRRPGIAGHPLPACIERPVIDEVEQVIACGAVSSPNRAVWFTSSVHKVTYSSGHSAAPGFPARLRHYLASLTDTLPPFPM